MNFQKPISSYLLNVFEFRAELYSNIEGHCLFIPIISSPPIAIKMSDHVWICFYYHNINWEISQLSAQVLLSEREWPSNEGALNKIMSARKASRLPENLEICCQKVHQIKNPMQFLKFLKKTDSNWYLTLYLWDV